MTPRASSWHALPLLALASIAATGGCGAAIRRGGIAQEFPDDRPEHVQAVLARMAAAAPRVDPGIVIGLTPAPLRLWAWDLEAQRLLWETDIATADTMPHAAGEWVVVEEGSDVVVRAMRDGRVSARIPTGELRLAGADGEGELSVLTVSSGGGVGALSRVIVLSGGSPAWQIELEQAVGEPALRAGMVFLPWGQQNLSILDARTQEELARVRYTRGVVGHAIAQGAHVFFGQRGITRLTGHTDSSPDAPWFEPMERDLPGDPGMLRDAYQPPPGPTSATHRVRLVWRAIPSRGEEPDVGVLDDTIYLVFYRLVFALDAMQDHVRWVQQLPGDVVGASAENHGILIVDEQGRIHVLSREDGRVTFSAEAGMPATWAHVSYTELQGGEPRGEGMALRDQLLSLVQNTDARLVPARAYGARLLAALPEPDVTANLIALCDDRTLPPVLHDEVCEALASRENGSEHVIAALDRHASYLRGTSAPPVGPLARSAARARSQAAVPLLIAQLRDPSTPAADLEDLANALRELGAASAADPLDDFVRLYHAESPDDEALGRALAAAVAAYAALAGPASQDTLRWLIDDTMSHPAAREAAATALATVTAPATATTTATASDSDGEMTISTAERPERITLPMVNEVLHAVEPELDRCLIQPGRVYGQARVVLAFMPDGSLQTISVTPAPLQECIEAIVRTRTFPATLASTRQTITYTVAR